LGVGEYILYQSGELQSIRSIVTEQIESGKESHYDKILFRDHISSYLFEHLLQRELDVVVLGQSITGQFQSKMFHPLHDRFFNGSNVFGSMADLEYIIQEISNGNINRPKVIVIGLDPLYLKWQQMDRSVLINNARKSKDYINSHFRAIKLAMRQLRTKVKSSQGPIMEPQSYGLRGRQGLGRRQDGSGDDILIQESYKTNPIYIERNNFKERLRLRQYPFESPLNLKESLVGRLYELLDQLKKENVDVVFYCQQFSSDFMDYARQDEAFMVLWNQFVQLSMDLENQGYAIFPPGTPEDIGLDDRYMRDANHAGEVMTAIQLLNLLEKKGASLGMLRDIDIDHLRRLIDHRKSEMEL